MHKYIELYRGEKTLQWGYTGRPDRQESVNDARSEGFTSPSVRPLLILQFHNAERTFHLD